MDGSHLVLDKRQSPWMEPARSQQPQSSNHQQRRYWAPQI